VRLLAAGLVALSACGRIDFDARVAASDAASPDMMLSLGHDEDGDGIADANDPCPHVAGTTIDTDGDGVGDDCDIHPTTPTEHWLAFYTMQAGDQPFDDITAFTQETDALRAGGDAGPNILVSLVNARIDVGWDINALVGTGQHQLSFGFDDSTGTNTEYYFVELNQNGVTRDAAIVTYDATNGYVMQSAMDPGDLHAGAGFNRVDTGPATMAAVIGWTPSELYSLSTPATGYAHTDKIAFSLRGLDVSIRYVAIITSN
jgi:hypothetical protein